VAQTRRWLRLLVSVGILVLIAACQPERTPRPAAVRPTDSPERAALIAADPNLQAGQAVYNLRCAHCHGYAGEGQLASTIPTTEALGLHTVPPHDATGHTWQHPSQLLRDSIRYGIQNPLVHYPMPAFQGAVTDEEIEQLIAYMRLWWTDEQRAWQDEVTQRRAELDAELGIGGGG
jgi:mono/diheme cytochrome c family protein